jgi:YVTN family beta-propeller protein
MKRTAFLVLGLLCAALSLLHLSVLGCAASSLDRAGESDDDAFDATPSGTEAPDDNEPPTPPENEDDFLGVRPGSSEVYVFVANPGRDTVSKINAETREIETIEVGVEPIQVVVDSLYERAVTFNQGGDSVSIIDVMTNAVQELGVREDFNRMVMSPDGAWVICYFDAALVDADFGVEGVRSFTEISVVDLDGLAVHSFSVGFNPKRVIFTQDSARAVLSSDEYLGVVELGMDPIEVRQHFLEVPLDDPPPTGEVVLTPDGSRAFVRKNGEDQLRLVELGSGSVEFLDGGLDPSDLDLSPDGSEAVLVSRGSNELRLFSTADPLAPPVVLPTPAGEVIGSLVLSADGDKGLLFTTAAATDHITFWDRTNDDMTVRSLIKPVEAVSLAPDGRSALIVHTLGDVPGDLDYWTDHHAISVVSLDSWIVNPVATEARPLAWANSVDGRFSAFIMESSLHVGVIDFNTRLVDDVLVPSQPVFVGVMPLQTQPENALAWVSQEHSLGRISFVRLMTLTVETITGFELNAQID